MKLYTIQAQVTKDFKIGDMRSVQFWLLIEWTSTGGKVIGQYESHEAAVDSATNLITVAEMEMDLWNR